MYEKVDRSRTRKQWSSQANTKCCSVGPWHGTQLWRPFRLGQGRGKMPSHSVALVAETEFETIRFACTEQSKNLAACDDLVHPSCQLRYLASTSSCHIDKWSHHLDWWPSHRVGSWIGLDCPFLHQDCHAKTPWLETEWTLFALDYWTAITWIPGGNCCDSFAWRIRWGGICARCLFHTFYPWPTHLDWHSGGRTFLCGLSMSSGFQSPVTSCWSWIWCHHWM